MLKHPILQELEARVRDDRSFYPNSPALTDYLSHAEDILVAQVICTSSQSTGAYYEVAALYDPAIDEAPGGRFGATPLGLLFEDYSRSELRTWLVEVC